MINEVKNQILEHPSDFGLFLIIVFVIVALAFGIPAVLSRSMKRVLLVLCCTIFATLGTYIILF